MVVPVSGPGRPVVPTGDSTGLVFLGVPEPGTRPDRVFWEEGEPVTTPDRVFGGGNLTGDRSTEPGFETGFPFFKKIGTIVPIFFFHNLCRTDGREGRGMSKTET